MASRQTARCFTSVFAGRYLVSERDEGFVFGEVEAVDDVADGTERVVVPALAGDGGGIPFDPPHDKFECWQEDWSSCKEEQISIAAGFHVQQAWVVNGPTMTD